MHALSLIHPRKEGTKGTKGAKKDMNKNDLVVGRTYFRLTFADRDFTMPGVEPLVFLGEVTEDGRPMLAFQDTVSYVRFGDAFDPSTPSEEVAIDLKEPEQLAGNILDVDTLAREKSRKPQIALLRWGIPVCPRCERAGATGWSD